MPRRAGQAAAHARPGMRRPARPRSLDAASPRRTAGRPPSSAGRKGAIARVFGGVAELLLDAQQAVVLRDPLGSADRAGLDLARVERHDEVRDGGVLGLAGAMADDRGAARVLRHLDRLDRLRQRPETVELSEDAVRGALSYCACQALGLRHPQIVAHYLDAASAPFGAPSPRLPVVLGQAVLQAHDRVALDPVRPEIDELRPG